jgi:hypothetical protein
MVIIFITLVGWMAFNLCCYVGWIPHLSASPCAVNPLGRQLGTALYGLAYLLSLLRLPFAILPYVTKVSSFLLFRLHYDVGQYATLVEAVRIIGDFANFAVTTILMMRFGLPFWLIVLFAASESVRLVAEKGQMIVSALWQQLPHRQAAHWLKLYAPDSLWAGRYYSYYGLSDHERMDYILRTLKHLPAVNPEAGHKLNYVNGFRIVPQECGLRAGKVRDVARGEIFIHRKWTNDPWLLVGQALRRSPWMFDPRYLSRPFYYRTQSNRLATLFVLQHVRFCPPYALYQIGHEIKAARYDLFYRLGRFFRVDFEAKIKADGTAQFDQLIYWLDKSSFPSQENHTKRELWSDKEALADIRRRINAGELLTAQKIAVDYTYPMKYVEEVLWGEVCSVR